MVTKAAIALGVGRVLPMSMLAAALVSCVSTGTIEPVKRDIDSARSDRSVSSAWLRDHRVEVENRIVLYLQSKYPTVPPEIGSFRVGRVQVKNQVPDRDRARVEELETALARLFESVTLRVLGTRPDTGTTVDIEVEFLTPQLSKGEEAAAAAAMAPMMAVCFGTLLVACPAKMSNYVVLVATVRRNDSVVASLKGAGGATRYVSTLMLEDKPSSGDEANSKAMAGAVADLASKLVPYLRVP